MEEMMTLEELMKKELPLNRKERFFTGTVLPMIICRDNFKNFGLFTSLIEDCDELEVSANPNSSNIQFFTEYSLVESIYDQATKGRFPNPPISKDTPDIVILITGRHKTLIAIEAKMYDTPDSVSLRNQMNNQKDHIDYLSEKLGVERAIQCALLPAKLGDKVSNLDYQIITWEKIHDTYKKVCPEDYFLNLLDISLKSYGKLVSNRRQYGKNCEKKMYGADIYNNCESGSLDMNIMGRYLGLKGDHLLKDISSGRWRAQEYETSSKKRLPNDNWFFIKDFVELIDRIGD